MVKRKKTNSFSLKTYFSLGILILSLAGLLFFFFYSDPTESDYLETGYHTHADFLILINGETLNFSEEKYMERADFIHLHDGKGELIHYHKENLSFVNFLSTLNIFVTETCLEMNEEKYCTNDSHKLSLFVNGTEVKDVEKYVPEDLDRILLFYGTEEELQKISFDEVNDEACIYSEKCPERGEAPPESCSGTSCPADIEWLI